MVALTHMFVTFEEVSEDRECQRNCFKVQSEALEAKSWGNHMALMMGQQRK